MKLTIKDFRRCRAVKIASDKPVQLLLGENQQGKSSILGAVVVALTGAQPAWLTRRGESVYDLRRDGAKKAEIDLMLTVDGADGPVGYGVNRVLLAKSQALEVDVADGVNTTPWTGTTTEQQTRLCEYLGLSAKQLSCLLHGGEFIGMDTKQQVEFLASISGAELTSEQLREKLFDESPAGTIMPPLDTWKSDLTGSALLDECLKVASEKRLESKRVVTQKEALLQAAQEALVAAPAGEEPDDPAGAVDALGARYTKSLEQAGRVSATAQALASAKQTLEDRETELAAAQAAAEAAPRAEMDAAQRAVNEAQATNDAAGDAVDEADRQELEVRQKLTMAREELEAAQNLAEVPLCPCCQQPLSQELRAKLVTDAEASVSLWTEKFGTETTNLRISREARQVTIQALTQARSTLAGIQKQVADLDAAVDKAQRAKLAAEEAVTKSQAALDALEIPEDTAEIEAEIETLSAWVDYQRGAQQVADAQQALDGARAAVAPWEWLCEKFGSGPESYRRELTKGKLATLEAAVNEALDPLTGEKIAFPVGDVPLSVVSMGSTRAARDMYLSGSERKKLEIALQYGFCKALGFPLLLVDCEAALDARSTSQVLGFCKSVTETWPGVQMLVAMAPTRTDWREKFNPVLFEGWSDVWAIVDGTAERMTGGIGTDAHASEPLDEDGEANLGGDE